MTTRAEVMPADHAEWIRGHAWTPKMRKTYAQVPGAYTACACQWGQTGHCQDGRHDKCHRATPMPVHEGFVCGPSGVDVLNLPESTWHRTTTATGRHRSSETQVWLADRVCRWRCSCDCHPALPQPVRKPTQLDLFAA